MSVARQTFQWSRRAMTSKKTKQERLNESRMKRARAMTEINTRGGSTPAPPGAIMADPAELSHNNTYASLPRFYVDRVIQCRTCQKEEVWTAEQQKWWYEIAKGHIHSQAVHCRACRDKEKARSDIARLVHQEGLNMKRRKTDS